MQTTSNLLMIQPVNFEFNAQTAVNNSFQVADGGDNAQERAVDEFANLVGVLREHGLDVTVVEDTPYPHTPDSIFPNNWISFHDEGSICLYPMYADNRRNERKQSVLQVIHERFEVKKTIDFSYYEKSDLFLEGTGSMVLDRDQKIAYACLSPRTSRKVLQVFCDQMGYQPVMFHAEDNQGLAIYHTNVMMCVADHYIVICLESLSNKEEKEELVGVIRKSEKEIIEISIDQMNHFAGNMLQVENKKKEKLLVMSTQAFESLNPKQIKKLKTYNPIIHAELESIETNGGGSARCMIAEVHLPEKP
jgi:hypothetical protein